MNFAFILLLIVKVVHGELFCIYEIDPVCERELNKLHLEMGNPDEMKSFIVSLISVVAAPDFSSVRNEMISYLIKGLLGIESIECSTDSIISTILDTPNDNLNLPDIVNPDLFLGPKQIQTLTDDIKSGILGNNEETLEEFLDDFIKTAIKPQFDAVDFDEKLTLAVTFSFTACITLYDKFVADINGCIGYGYTVAMNGKNEIKYFVTGSLGTTVTIGPSVDMPVGFDYSIGYDFLADIGNVAGFWSSVGVGASASVPALTIFDDILFGINLPTGVGFTISYNGPIPGIDCLGIGIAFNAFDTTIGASVGTSASIAYTRELVTIPTDSCAVNYGVFDTSKLGQAQVGEPCVIHEDCDGAGFGLSDVACCANTCQHKENGFCPAQSIGSDCCAHTDCKGWGLESDDIACCDGVCERKIADWAGVGYCPHECRAGLFCPEGSCEDNKSSGESCDCDGQCAGYGLGIGDMQCCDGKCRALIGDWINFPWCPHECRAGIDCPVGSCDDNKSSGESCECSGQCSGDMKCCNGECQTLQTDWAGIGYCPHECKAGLDCPAGSCDDNKSSGESCECSGQCSGNMKCCNGECKALQTDWAGIGYCPHECKAGIDCPAGSCDDDRSSGESCDCTGQCSGSMKCCNGKCQTLQTDWFGVDYCPHECKAGIDCPAGSCDDNVSQYGSCSCSGQCAGSMTCCGGQCRHKQRDWAGVYYCPHECKDGPWCPSGSCGDNKSEYSSCSCSEQCAGSMTCCAGQCRYKQRDWAGVYYCPHECNGGCGRGTCPSGRSAGQSCSCRGQCGTGCCEGGRCVNKKRDWAGVYYCPAECRGGFFKGTGTC